MSWKELTLDNIEEIKDLYRSYLKKSNSLNTLCFEDFIESLEQCSMCRNYNLSANMFDTEGQVNGGIGLVCESCHGDIL